MAEISAKAVKELRDKTGAGMMDCKKALGEAGGDLERAVEVLRERGLAKAVKRAGRETTEGTIAIALAGPPRRHGGAGLRDRLRRARHRTSWPWRSPWPKRWLRTPASTARRH